MKLCKDNTFIVNKKNDYQKKDNRTLFANYKKAKQTIHQTLLLFDNFQFSTCQDLSENIMLMLNSQCSMLNSQCSMIFTATLGNKNSQVREKVFLG